MKTAFTLLAGVAIGALAIQGLHAQQTGGQQQMPKVIYVSEIDVSNPEGYGKEFAPKAQELIKKHGGRVLAIGGTGGGPIQTHHVTSFSGEPPNRLLKNWAARLTLEHESDSCAVERAAGGIHARFGYTDR